MKSFVNTPKTKEYSFSETPYPKIRTFFETRFFEHDSCFLLLTKHIEGVFNRLLFVREFHQDCSRFILFLPLFQLVLLFISFHAIDIEQNEIVEDFHKTHWRVEVELPAYAESFIRKKCKEVPLSKRQTAWKEY